MKKNVLLVCAAVMLALCLSATNALAVKDQCIELTYIWQGDNSTPSVHVWLDSDGTFFGIEEEGEGFWSEYGGSFALQLTDGCMPLYAGTKKRGFFECTGGEIFFQIPSGAGTPPEGYNVYRIKKVNRKFCEEMMLEQPQAVQKDGPSFSSPE